MSTRSGKRIHNSCHENTIKVDNELGVKSKRKTRSTRLKENVDELSVSLFKAKKRNNYVSYPTDDEQNSEEVINNNDTEARHGRTLRRNTLKEHNIVVQNSDIIETSTEPRILIRKSRRGKNHAEVQPENLENVQVHIIENPKSKKNKKETETPAEEDTAPTLAKKSKRKKKKSKQSNSMTVEEVKQDGNSRNNACNKSMSMESFHSAAGSPKINCEHEPALLGFAKHTTSSDRKSSITDSTDKLEVAMTLDAGASVQGTNKRKSIQKDSVSMVNSRNILLTDPETESITSDNSYNENAKRKSNINNGTFDKLTKIIDTTFEKDTGNVKKDSTYDNSGNNNLDTTFENNTGATSRKKSRVKVATFDKNEKIDERTIEKDAVLPPQKSAKRSLRTSNIKDTTFGKSDKIEDTTFDKDTLSIPHSSEKKSLKKKRSIKDTNEKVDDTTLEKDTILTPRKSARKSLSRQSSVKDTTFDKNDVNIYDTTFEKYTFTTTFPSAKESLSRQSSVKDTTFDKNDHNVVDTTFEKDTTSTTLLSAKKSISRQLSVKETTFYKNDDNVDDKTFENDTISTTLPSAKERLSRQSSVKDTTFDKNDDNVDDTTFEKDTISTTLPSAQEILSRQSSVKDNTFDKNDDNVNDTTFEKDTISTTLLSAKKRLSRKSSVNETTFDKNENFDEATLVPKSSKICQKKANAKASDSDNVGSSAQKVASRKSIVEDNIFESNISEDIDNEISNSIKKRKSGRFNSHKNEEVINEKQNSTFDKDLKMEREDEIKKKSLQSESKHYVNDQGSKLNSSYKRNSKCSLISSDNSEIEKSYISCISITDDESENTMNSTPVLIESSMDNSKQDSPAPQTPLKREGTFTKDGPEVLKDETPSKEELLPLAGCTPYHVTKSSQKRVLNVTRSIEKSRLSTEPPRMTRVMFCSPVDYSAGVGQEKRKVIKSNLKGSNKSFIFDDSVSVPSPRPPPAGRKRSYTQSDADDERRKRKRLADDLQQSVDRLSRPRTSSAAAKLTEPTTPKKPATPSKSKSDAKPGRTKLPNFAALHQRQFSKMESLGDCQERRAKRARQLLTPNGAVNMLERISPKDNVTGPQKPKEQTKKIDTPTKLPSLESLRPGFNRFGFKLNLDFNPFSVPSQHPEPKPKPNGAKQALPSLAGATSVRREVAKQAVMREKSFTDRRNAVNRNENRTIIKGVRTNRRFELQMKMRNVE